MDCPEGQWFASLLLYNISLCPMTMLFTQSHDCVSKLDELLNLYYNRHISDSILSYNNQSGHDGGRMYGIYAYARFDDHDLGARS